MQTEPGKFELTLSMTEVIVLFFVMVSLFTGLLIFGYRVGYQQSTEAIPLQSRPAAPAQQSPQVEKQTPVEVEPELRLKNSPPKPGDLRFAPVEAGDPDSHAREPVAVLLGEGRPRPCKADSYLSYLRKTLPNNRRFAQRLADWAGVPADDAARPRREPSRESNAVIAADGEIPAHDGQPEAANCNLPADLRALRSVAC